MAYLNLEMRIMSDFEDERCGGDCLTCILRGLPAEIEAIFCQPCYSYENEETLPWNIEGW